MKAIEFKIEKKIDGALGRAGVLKTTHGDILTPAFVPVGTKGVMKGMTPEMMKEMGAQVVLSNTYHLYLQPGDELVRDGGGLHKLMHWDGPLMTDSGGFQVFSLGVAYGKGISKVLHPADISHQVPERSSADEGVAKLATVGNDGVSFRSHIDGSLHYFTPEKSIEIQHNLGADIIFAFDECTSPTEDRRYQEEALVRTHNWAKRCLTFHKEKDNSNYQALFGVVQGGRDEELRRRSAQFFAGMDFDGYGIGGSFDKNDLHSAVKWVNEELPEEKPRHLLGIGEPEDLFSGVENGVDLFDCVSPTRNGRSGGSLYTKEGRMNIMNAKYRNDFTPIESDCLCYACKYYTKAYISHLFRADEMMAGMLSSIHNTYFLVNLVKEMRENILNGTFSEFKKSFMEIYGK